MKSMLLFVVICYFAAFVVSLGCYISEVAKVDRIKSVDLVKKKECNLDLQIFFKESDRFLDAWKEIKRLDYSGPKIDSLREVMKDSHEVCIAIVNKRNNIK